MAPTILRLLGYAPTTTDGVVLADALTAPSALEARAQLALSKVLRSHRDSLIAVAQEQIAEDRKTHANPPPAVAAIP